MDRIDPLGYAGRDGAKVRDDWQGHAERYGALKEIRVLATTRSRGRNSDQRITAVRLYFAGGNVDEHVIWFADDEVYWIPGRPSTMSVLFRPAHQGGLVGFDLLKQEVYQIGLSEDGIRLTVVSSGNTTLGQREQ